MQNGTKIDAGKTIPEQIHLLDTGFCFGVDRRLRGGTFGCNPSSTIIGKFKLSWTL